MKICQSMVAAGYFLLLSLAIPVNDVLAQNDSNQASAVRKPFAINYRPPKTGAPATRVGGGSRGDQNATVCEVMAPEHTGYSSAAQPKLYWYTNAKTARVQFALINDDVIEPLLELDIKVPLKPGMQHLDLAENKVTLQEGKTYQWSVAVVADENDHSSDVVASGTIVYKAPDATLASRLSQLHGLALASAYAEAGYWYDAFNELNQLKAKNSADANVTAMLVELANQSGLSNLAEKL